MDTLFSYLDSVYGILAIVMVLGGLIFFHELGHFLAARLCRVGVKTFSLGFGPRLWGVKRGATEYKVSLVPLGGYVSMVGEEDPRDIPAPFTEKDSFANRSSLQRLVIIFAGPLVNLALAWVLFWGVFFVQGQEYLLPDVGTVSPASAAARAGIKPGDRIIAVNGARISRWDELVRAVMASEGADMSFSLQRDGQTLVVRAKPQPFERKTIFGETLTSWAIGLTPSGAAENVPLGLFASARAGFSHTIWITKIIGESVVKMFEGVVPLESMGGPIRIAKEIHRQAEVGSVTGIFLLAAFISLNLGLLNLLPIPVLDGGHILFLLIEMLRRKPVSEKTQAVTIYVGITLLAGLMIFTTYNDISQWIAGKL
ncbi:zinc metalloprotease [Deltaproteobacteria bacterium]|nr:zinc metalloprotease [Deltaproteobacteria bacterium]